YLLLSLKLPPTPALYPLSLHDALPILPLSPEALGGRPPDPVGRPAAPRGGPAHGGPGRVGRGPREPGPAARHEVLAGGGLYLRRSEEHTSELQSRGHLVCRLLLEKKKK